MKRYNSVREMMIGEGISKRIIAKFDKLVAEDEKYLTIHKEKGKVFLVDTRTGKKL